MNPYTRFDPLNPPPPLMTGEPGSFAHKTMAVRVPGLLDNVVADHAGRYPDEINRALADLRAEIVAGRPMRPLETSAPDGPDWAAAFAPYQGKSWLEIPWYFAEVFFYRRLLEITNYFGGHAGLEAWVGLDPFLPRKQAELNSEVAWRVLTAALNHAPDGSADSFKALLHHCIWGNRIDLSHPHLAQASGHIAVQSEQENLLVDDTEAVLMYLQGGRGVREQGSGGRRSIVGGRIDFICDNAGVELLLDLALAAWLLRFDWVKEITLHVKGHPTFVSDTIPADVETTLAAIRAQPAVELVSLADELEAYRRQGRLRVRPDYFWNSSHFFWEIPVELQAELAQAALVIVKGDANYRRLIGDSRWPAAVSMAEAAPYFPVPFVCLRTMKSDAVVGLPSGLAEQLDGLDPAWRVNGQRGLIQARL